MGFTGEWHEVPLALLLVNIQQNMDPNARKFLKSYPWIGLIVTATFAIVLAFYLTTKRIRVTNSRFEGAYYIEYADRPTDFIIITTLVAIATIGSAFYCILRIRSRKKYLAEDAQSTNAN